MSSPEVDASLPEARFVASLWGRISSKWVWFQKTQNHSVNIPPFNIMIAILHLYCLDKVLHNNDMVVRNFPFVFGARQLCVRACGCHNGNNTTQWRDVVELSFFWRVIWDSAADCAALIPNSPEGKTYDEHDMYRDKQCDNEHSE